MKSLAHLIAVAVLTALPAACTSRIPHDPLSPSPGAQAGNIRHVVLIDLAEPGDSTELIADMDRCLAPIPGVVSYWRGSRMPNDRPEVSRDFDVGLVIDFRDAASYDAYVVDPRHVELVTKWKPRCTSLRVFDILPNSTP